MNRHEALQKLKELNDVFHRDLRAQADSGIVKATDRHSSILTHGYTPVASEANHLRTLYGQLEKLIQKDGGAGISQHLTVARSMRKQVGGTPLALLLPP
jgi:hypothetical protein